MIPVANEHDGWDFEEGAQIAPGRSVLKSLGGGSRYEVLLVWDDRLFAIAVAKVLRPAFVGTSARCGSSRRGGRPRARWLTPCSSAASTRCSTARTRTC